jgi:16S rRNA pseudouridine516 synthase
MKNVIELATLLSHSGFGTKKECQKLILTGNVKLNNSIIKIPSKKLDTSTNHIFEISGTIYPIENDVHIFFNKPKDIECSHSPFSKYKSIFSLLPIRFLKRKNPIRCAGRLDVDTTGLLFLSTDGNLIHKFQNEEISKTYKISLKHEWNEEMRNSLLNGVLLKDGKFVTCLDLNEIDSHTIEMKINKGLYHQVKRMISAVGNRVEELERISIGKVNLKDLDLKIGEWKSMNKIEF